VTQVDVLEEYSLLLVLSNRSLLSYQLGALDPNEPISSKRAKKIQSHCNFFKTGICLSRHLVCCVKSSALSTTIKVYEPNDAMSRTKKQKGLSKMFNAGQDELKPFKEFYIPTESSSVHFLKSKLCVACARGFEVVSLETLETQSLLDQADTSLDFVSRKEGVKPIHIERLNGEFLLNYSDFSFFVNRNGWRARPEWRLDWEGTPQTFALSYPWILAFEPNFIEFRHIENLAVHIVPHRNIRMLHSSTHEVSFVAVRTWWVLVLTRNRFCLRMKMNVARMSSWPLIFGRASGNRRCPSSSLPTRPRRRAPRRARRDWAWGSEGCHKGFLRASGQQHKDARSAGHTGRRQERGNKPKGHAQSLPTLSPRRTGHGSLAPVEENEETQERLVWADGLGQRGTWRVGPNLGWVVSRFVSAYITCSRKAGWLEEEGASLIFTIYLPFILISCLGIVVLRFLAVPYVLCCFSFSGGREGRGREEERVWICILGFWNWLTGWVTGGGVGTAGSLS
jgi:hypothetical protein